MTYVVAILETMWDWRQQTSGAGYSEALRFFRINPHNSSGRRLYKLVGDESHLLVTNACRELVSGPQHHGVGDPSWLGENLRILDGERYGPTGQQKPSGFPTIDILLVCGKVAQKTYRACGYKPMFARVVEMPHPAARTWTRYEIARHQLLCR